MSDVKTSDQQKADEQKTNELIRRLMENGYATVRAR